MTENTMVDFSQKYDVLVIGGGNAALCAAISAARNGASVAILEAAPRFYRGGNTRHTRNVRFQPSLGGTLSLGRTNSFFLGGGRSMLNALYRTAYKLGVKIAYDAEVADLIIKDNKFSKVTLTYKGQEKELAARALVTASGGFEANIEWLKQGWGDIAENFLIRGTPYNKGSILKNLISKGIKTIGDPTQCHAVAIDARAP